MIDLKILDARIGTEWPLPQRATAGSAGVDLYAALDDSITLAAGQCELLPSGIAIHIANPQWVGLIYPRSGLGYKHGIVLGNLTGVIDSDYQGEIKIPLWNRSDRDYQLDPGDRIAQLVIAPVVSTQFNVVESLADSSRGAGGFGHSGR